MKDLGDPHYFLGIEVIRPPVGILISQCHYVLSMLFKFGMADCKFSYPVSLIRQFMARPTEEHLQCAQCILRYVSGTKERGPLYRTGIVEQLVGVNTLPNSCRQTQ